MSENNIFTTILSPKAIAIVGASRSPQKVGNQVLQNLINGKFRGQLIPINPNARTINGLRCYPSLLDVPIIPDLAIIVTPAPLVIPVLEEAAKKRVKVAIVISAGFAESGPQGKVLQNQITSLCHTYPIRVLGPNCLGCFSTPNHVNATFGPSLPESGNIMLISQSGALVTGILDWAKRYHLGMSHAVTLGNRVDINEVDALQFAALDPKTKIILMYLESFAHAPDLFALASKITPQKPILLLKGGQSQAGQIASASHTASLATNYVLVKSFARQVGIALADNIQDWLTTAYVLSTTTAPKGRHLGIITNAGGPGVLATDTAIAHHLQVSPFSAATTTKLERSLPNLPAHNPLDILGDAPPERFAQAFKILKSDPTLDALVVIMTPQTTTKPITTARMLIQSIDKHKTTLIVLLGGNQLQTARTLFEAHAVPTFTYPTEAISTLATVVWYTTHQRTFYRFPATSVAYVSQSDQKRLIASLSTKLDHAQALELLRSYAFTIPRSRIITQLSDVSAALDFVGRPAVVKTASMHLPHKAKYGGVYLGLMTSYHARMVTRKLMRLHPEVLFQQTIHSQLELILGCRRDPQLGPFITVGLGGSLTDAIGDRSYAFIPTQKSYLAFVFSQTNAAKLLHEKKIPASLVVSALHRLSAIMIDFPQIKEIEINPAMVTPTHLYACDIKITISTKPQN